MRCQPPCPQHPGDPRESCRRWAAAFCPGPCRRAECCSSAVSGPELSGAKAIGGPPQNVSSVDFSWSRFVGGRLCLYGYLVRMPVDLIRPATQHGSRIDPDFCSPTRRTSPL
ncbi:hypothetical protein GQ607_005940 [Colletotrichum asianum]|uniref:Uncharacterized protein n=1 Tax=Colletotrichum asianum TaxID=702518 RepID=A0A8H3WLT4_9PEZI|nr:hypothetical protein GQ607_005940 [Colletotrichum asianum]